MTLGDPARARGYPDDFVLKIPPGKNLSLTLFRQRLEQHFSFSMILAFRPRGACTPSSVQCKRQLKAAARLAKHWQKGILTKHVRSKDRTAFVTLSSVQPDLIAFCQARAHIHAHTHAHTRTTLHTYTVVLTRSGFTRKGGLLRRKLVGFFHQNEFVLLTFTIRRCENLNTD